jgi:hypothetical protein
MESSSFYITLPSNASMDFYSDNTASNYTIRMPRTFYLQGKYEVALAEIQYPHTWNSMKTFLNYFVCYRPNGETDNYKLAWINVGYYKTVHQLCDDITERIEEREGTKNLVVFKYRETSRQVYIKTNDYEVAFSAPLAEMLGFTFSFNDAVWYGNAQFGERKANLNSGFYTLYTYCSLCEAQVVGDYYVPLLRTIPIEGEDGDLIMKTYSEPHYVPVNTSKFDTIEINIKDDQGENVAFESGKVLCKLHFRQKAL